VLRCHQKKTVARTTAHSTVVPQYGMPAALCRPSDAPVPKIAIAYDSSQ
jgi:hypothetical protein